MKVLLFLGCALQDVNMRNIEILQGSSIFAENHKLQIVNMTNAPIQVIPPRAFSSCSGLKKVILSRNITRIEFNAFSNCNALTSIYLWDTVNCIYDNCFEHCSSLEIISIPKTTKVESRVFVGCWKLLSYPSGNLSVLTQDLKNRYSDLKLHRECNKDNVTYEGIEQILEEDKNRRGQRKSLKRTRSQIPWALQKDKWGILPIQILVTNPNATNEMVNLLAKLRIKTENFYCTTLWIGKC